MHTVAPEQQCTLLEIINEEFGSQLVFDGFADAVLGLFEDVPGFETISQTRANRYHDALCAPRTTAGYVQGKGRDRSIEQSRTFSQADAHPDLSKPIT